MTPVSIRSNGWKSCFQSAVAIKQNRSPSTKLCQRSQKKSSGTLMKSSQALPRPSVLFVTPDEFSRDIPKAIALTKGVLGGGVSLVQVRDRKGTPQDVLKVVEALLAENVPPRNLVINGMDPRDVLTMGDGLGVHIKEKHIEQYLPYARDVMPPDTIIGCAVHNAEIAKKAVDIHVPDYFQVGTMFATMSHPGKIPEGPTLLGEIREVVGSSPLLIGIGGIEPDNVSTIIEHGGDGVAVVTLLAAAESPSLTAAELLGKCRAAYSAKQIS